MPLVCDQDAADIASCMALSSHSATLLLISAFWPICSLGAQTAAIGPEKLMVGPATPPSVLSSPHLDAMACMRSSAKA